MLPRPSVLIRIAGQLQQFVRRGPRRTRSPRAHEIEAGAAAPSASQLTGGGSIKLNQVENQERQKRGRHQQTDFEEVFSPPLRHKTSNLPSAPAYAEMPRNRRPAHWHRPSVPAGRRNHPPPSPDGSLRQMAMTATLSGAISAHDQRALPEDKRDQTAACTSLGSTSRSSASAEVGRAARSARLTLTSAKSHSRKATTIGCSATALRWPTW
jgi:hypothetical protein